MNDELNKRSMDKRPTAAFNSKKDGLGLKVGAACKCRARMRNK